MAVIMKIREKSLLILIMLGLAMGAFLLGDAFRGGFFNDNAPKVEGVLQVGEKSISAAQYEGRINAEILGYGQYYSLFGRTLGDQEEEQIKNIAWEKLVNDLTIKKQANSVGIFVKNDEYDDLRWGENISPAISSLPIFKDSLGNFNPANVEQIFEQLRVNENLMAYHDVLEGELKTTRLTEKYLNAIKMGLSANSLEAKESYHMANAQYDFQFVFKKYNEIPDSLFTVSDSELEEYYNKHKNEDKYQQTEETRSIKFVLFDIYPSANDRAMVEQKANSIAEAYVSAENDSLFVSQNSESPYFQTVYNPRFARPEIDTQIVNGKVGDVIGPYLESNTYKISKITGKGIVPEVNARHILFSHSPTSDTTALEIKADSIRKVIKRNNNFEEMAREFSGDQGSANQGGNLDWFGEGIMLTEFNDACFNGKVGDMPIVITRVGVHLIEILDRREIDQIKIVDVNRKVAPSKATKDSIYNIAVNFSIDNNTLEKFENKIEEDASITWREEANLNRKMKNVGGLSNATNLINWAYNYNTEVGQVSSVISLGNKYSVGILQSIKKEGTLEIKDVKLELETEVLKTKKADYIISTITPDSEDINEIANAYEKPVLTATNYKLSEYILPSGGGNEPLVIGAVSNLEESNTSDPIEGENGIFVVKLTKKYPATETDDFSFNKQTMSESLRTKVESRSVAALRKALEMKDRRIR